MTLPQFRIADDADVDALVDLVERAYRGDSSREGWCTEADLLDGQRVDAAMMRSTIDDPDAVVLVLHDAGQPVACCELRRVAAGMATLGMFAVDPTQQAGGLGRRVIDEGERLVAERWGAERLEITVIDVRTSLIEWYERRGFERTGELRPFPYGDERFGVPRVDGLRFAVLEKRLRVAGGKVDDHV
ncbi:MAG: GNAT family N-acetyltransferase [Actinomycetota bacterium]|nr:GNAT family N-acetyltransferase [Actinomycetota bacterium]